MVKKKKVLEDKPKKRGKQADGSYHNPTKYKKSMCEDLIKLMTAGKSGAHFCAKNSISDKSFENWRRKYPELEEAFQIGKKKSEVWWQDMAQEHLTYNSFGTQLNPVIWSMNMRNRFAWTEHRRVQVPHLSSGKTFADKFEILAEHIENGKLTSPEISALSNMLATGVKIAESAEMSARIEKLESLVEQRKEDDALSKTKAS